MNFEKVEMHTAVREGYQILLRADAMLMMPVNKPKIRSFYQHVADTCIHWAQQIYGEALRKEFLELDGIRERSSFGMQRYSLHMRCPYDEGKYTVLLCESKLTGQWKEPQKSYHRISHVWNTDEELALPQAQVLRHFGLKLRRDMLPFSPDGIYPEGEDMVFFRNVSDHFPFLEKKISRGSTMQKNT